MKKTPTAQLYDKFKKECLSHIKDEKEKELLVKRIIFTLVRI